MSRSSAVGEDKRAWLYARASTCRGKLSCCYCSAWVVRVSLAVRMDPQHVATLDHVLPIERGGSNSVMNFVVSCMRCNSVKGARPLSETSARRVLEELHTWPSHQALAYWRGRILRRAHERAPGAARWVRLLASPHWASPRCHGAHTASLDGTVLRSTLWRRGGVAGTAGRSPRSGRA